MTNLPALTTSSWPDSLRRLVTREDYVAGDRYVWQPQPVPEECRHAAIRILADLERELAPAPREWISARIATLLAHYWTPDMPENLQAAVAGAAADYRQFLQEE